ncbi:hypothetical protein L208DRAFT_1467249 [Tricholoma matsutake]|nr:hypothetical protein L208DRAFT_1467249 [Tricholoma matsutake 945]
MPFAPAQTPLSPAPTPPLAPAPTPCHPSKRARLQDDEGDSASIQPIQVDDTDAQHVCHLLSLILHLSQPPSPAVSSLQEQHCPGPPFHCRRGLNVTYFLKLALGVSVSNNFLHKCSPPFILLSYLSSIICSSSVLPLCLFLLFFFLFVSASFSPSVSVSALQAISLNANSLADPMKINAINSMVKSVKPHLVVIQETKSAQNVAAQLHLPGYDFHESLGCPIHN